MKTNHDNRITQALVRKLFAYDPATGDFILKPRPKSWFSADHIWKTWNTKNAGKRPSSTATSGSRYITYQTVSLFGRNYRLHRLIFLYMTGRWPSTEIDHLDGNGLNNRWANLAEVSRRGNAQNLPLFRNNTSGRMGVYRTRRKWHARVTFHQRIIRLGTYPTFAAACAARAVAERKFGFSPFHGRKTK
jgi:hypothetical protein